MFSREIADKIKLKFGIVTDRAMAERMQVKYGTFANWMARDSMQLDVIIKFLIKENIDLNSIFNANNAVSNSEILFGATTDIESSEIDAKIFNDFKKKFESYAEEGGRLLTAPFVADLQDLYDEYDQRVEKIKETFGSRRKK